MWPIHPHPENDELLSSWMVRLAHANCYKVHDFYCQYFGRTRQIWNRDIDHFAPDWLLNGLSVHSGLKLERLKLMTLRSLEGITYETYNETGITRGLLSVGVYHRTRRIFGQQFCPLCLIEDQHAYLRKSWRLATVVMCEYHHVILHDRCEHCHSPMMPHRSDMNSKFGFPQNIGIKYCSTCGKPFTKNQIIPAAPELIIFQKMVYESIHSGFISFKNEHLYSFLFLDGIRTLAQGIARSEMIKERINLNKIILELSDVDVRQELMSACANLMKDWPIHFNNYLTAHKQPYSTFISKNTKGTAPYWLDKTIKLLTKI